MSARWTMLLAIVAMVVALAAGCGGDDAETGNEPGPAAPLAGAGSTAPDATPPGAGSGKPQGSAAGADGAGAADSPSSSGGAGTESGRGGDGDGAGAESGGAGSLSKSAYLEQANRVCAKNQRETEKAVAAFAREHPGPGESNVLTVIREVRVPMLEAKAVALRELGAPRGDRKEIEEIVASIESLAEGISMLDDIDQVTAKLNREANQADRLARRYGLDRCAAG